VEENYAELGEWTHSHKKSPLAYVAKLNLHDELGVEVA
jgi:hypothetical protein